MSNAEIEASQRRDAYRQKLFTHMSDGYGATPTVSEMDEIEHIVIEGTKLHWTSEPPKVPGWYWVRSLGCESIMCINVTAAKGFVSACKTNPQSFRFAGPVPTPDDK